MVARVDSKSILPSEGLGVGSIPTRVTMRIEYEILEDYPFCGTIYEMWNYTADVLCGCSPKEYGMYWKKCIIDNANVNDLIKLLNCGVYITKVNY